MKKIHEFDMANQFVGKNKIAFQEKCKKELKKIQFLAWQIIVKYRNRLYNN